MTTVSPVTGQIAGDDRWARLRAGVRRHWLFLVALGGGLALRAVCQIAYKPALLYIDSYRYLANLHQLDPTTTQPIGYPLFVLRPVLWLGNLGTVVAAQHVLGLAMAAAIYALLVHRGAPRWLAVIPTLPVLFDGYQLQIEHNIMSETIFEALVLGAVVLLLWNRALTIRVLALAGGLVGLAVTVRAIGVVVIVPAVIFAVVAGPGGWLRVRRGAIIFVAFAVPVMGYGLAYSLTAGHVGLNRGDAALLYGRAAVIVEHCRSIDLPSYELPLCPAEPLGHRLGLNVYAHTSPYPARVKPPPGMSRDAVLRDFARHVFVRQPGDFAQAVLTDFAKGFAWSHTTSPGDPTVDRWQFQLAYPTFGHDPSRTTDRYGGGDPTVVEPLARFLRDYQLDVGFTPGPLLAAAFIVGLLGTFGIGRARRSGLQAACGLPTACGIVLLLGADFFEFSWRYQLPALTLAPLGGALGIMALTGWHSGEIAHPPDEPEDTEEPSHA
jgi:hypothetical protein